MASKRRLRRRACDGKQAHERERAERHAFALGLDRGYHAYKCPFCPHWHVGRKKRR